MDKKCENRLSLWKKLISHNMIKKKVVMANARTGRKKDHMACTNQAKMGIQNVHWDINELDVPMEIVYQSTNRIYF